MPLVVRVLFVELYYILYMECSRRILLFLYKEVVAFWCAIFGSHKVVVEIHCWGRSFTSLAAITVL